jgi:hypothetical protein
MNLTKFTAPFTLPFTQRTFSSGQVKSKIARFGVYENSRMTTSMWGFGTLSTRGLCGLEIMFDVEHTA